MLLNSWVLFSLSHPICLRLAISNSGATGASKRSVTNHPLFLIHLWPSFPPNCSGFKWTRQLQLWRLTPTKPSHTVPDHLHARKKKLKWQLKLFIRFWRNKRKELILICYFLQTHIHTSLFAGEKKRLFSITMKLHWSCIAKIHKIM